MYCYINEKLFKPFQSMGEKITPQFSNDWEVIFENYRTRNGIKLYSKKLNVTIADIDLYKLFHMLQNYKIDLKEGKCIQGEFIIGNDRKLYSKEDYQKWYNKYGKIVESKVRAKDLMLGREYRFKCGASMFLIAIDRDEKNKPIYVFAYKGDTYIIVKTFRTLQKVSSMTNNVISKWLFKVGLSTYLRSQIERTEYLKDPIGKLKNYVYKKVVLDPQIEIIDEDYFKGKFENWNCFCEIADIDFKFYNSSITIDRKIEDYKIVLTRKDFNNKTYISEYETKLEVYDVDRNKLLNSKENIRIFIPYT